MIKHRVQIVFQWGITGSYLPKLTGNIEQCQLTLFVNEKTNTAQL